MKYIIFDLEWNQHFSGFQRESQKKKIDCALKNEIIEIGAVKADESFHIIGEFNRLVRPKVNKKINPYVKKILHTDLEKCKTADEFPKVIEEFKEWCGREGAIFAWGSDDFLILKQNLHFYHMEETLPIDAYNLQSVFAKQFETEKVLQRSLKYAVEFFHISMEEEFHSALSDARYTFEVLKHMAEKIDPNQKVDFSSSRWLGKSGAQTDLKRFRVIKAYVMSDACKISTYLANHKTIRCPLCKQPAENLGSWLTSGDGRYYKMIRCEKHGYLLIKIKPKKDKLIKIVKKIRHKDVAAIQELLPVYTGKTQIVKAGEESTIVHGENADEKTYTK